MAKPIPTNHNGGVSPYSAAQHLEAVEKAEALMDDGRSANKAAGEVGAEYRVSRPTIQRWAKNLGRPLGQYNPESEPAHTAAARAAKRQYTGADYRTAADNLMGMTQAALAEVMELAGKVGHIAVLVDLTRIDLLLTRAIQREKPLIELGFGHEFGGGAGDEDEDGDRPTSLADWEAEAAAARRVRAQMAGEVETEDEG